MPGARLSSSSKDFTTSMSGPNSDYDKIARNITVSKQVHNDPERPDQGLLEDLIDLKDEKDVKRLSRKYLPEEYDKIQRDRFDRLDVLAKTGRLLPNNMDDLDEI